MNGNLLDTNIVLASSLNPGSLSADVRLAIIAGPNRISVVSLWEVVIKSSKGKLSVGDPYEWWIDSLTQLVAEPLQITVEHVLQVATLPPIHSDPFDRILIAQAATENLRILTADRAILEYKLDGNSALQ